MVKAVNEIKISAIIATVGRSVEIGRLLASIRKQDYPSQQIEIIVIDQNIDSDTQRVIEDYNDLHIRYIRTKAVGLSRARNLGLKQATGDIVCFPDDDCEYSEDLFRNILDDYNENAGSKVSIWQYPIYSLSDINLPVGRKWRRKRHRLRLTYAFMNTASAGIFIRRESITESFREFLGAGAEFGSCEDLIFVWDNILKKNKQGVYVGNSKRLIYHPSNIITNIQKQESYNRGHVKSWKIIFRDGQLKDKLAVCGFIAAQYIYHTARMFLGLVTINKVRITYHGNVILHRTKLMLSNK